MSSSLSGVGNKEKDKKVTWGAIKVEYVTYRERSIFPLSQLRIPEEPLKGRKREKKGEKGTIRERNQK